MPKFTDQSLMPFGKFKGTKLEQVEARYLLWLYEEMKDSDDKIKLFIYIHENRKALEAEVPPRDE
jgi:uncharacterized protein (DUF3820 family)